ncbi:nucleoside/nucleotide kinase family protein [Frankia nepalensis]|nr:thymidylate kinase [Frankia nepalensis]
MIALVGVDGSGKTTAAKWLAQELSAAGTRARYFENGGGRPLIDPLARRLGRRDGRHLLGWRGYLAVEASIRWIALARAVALSTLTRRVAVLDRYAYCQYALIRARDDGLAGAIGRAAGNAGRQPERLVRRLYGVFPRPDVTFYLAVEADEAARRVAARGRDLEEPAYLASFDVSYRSLPEFASFIVVDASGSAKEVGAAVLAVLAGR